MKQFRFCFLLAALFAASTMFAQTENAKNYIYLPYEYNFCVEELDMSIKIPEGWGFLTPSLKDTDATLEMRSGYVEYSSYSGSLKKTNSIFFMMPDAKEPCLELRMTAYGADQINENTISSEFGSFHLTDEIQEEKIESYQQIRNSQVITFRVLTAKDAERQTCKDIISSAQSCYDARYYSDYVLESDGESLQTQYIRYYAKDSTYYPELGFTFITPFDISAELEAPRININETTTLLTAYVSLEQLEGERAGVFTEGDFKMEYYFLEKGDTDQDDLESLFDDAADYSTLKTSCRRVFKYPIDGITSMVYAIGPSSEPTIAVVIPTKDYFAVFLFADVDYQKAEKVNDILSQIDIDDDKKMDAEQSDEYFMDFLSYLDYPVLKTASRYNDITLNKKASNKKVKLIEANIPEYNAKLYLPDLGQTYLYPSHAELEFDKKKKVYPVTLKNEQAESYDDITNSILTYTDEGTQCFIWFPEKQPSQQNADEYVQAIYSKTECFEENPVKRIGTADVNGQKWYVFSMTEYYTYDIFVTDYKGAIIEVRLVTNSSTDRDNYLKLVESLLYKAVFK